jgi:DNA polymerase (family 10)
MSKPRIWTNQEVADVLVRIGHLLEIKGESRFQYLAYGRAAESILNLGEEVMAIWEVGDLQSIPGVGDALSAKLDELFSTGRLRYLDNLYAEIPPGVLDLLEIPGVGPKTAKVLWEALGIDGIEPAREAALAGSLAGLPGIGAKTQARILAGIDALSRRSARTPLGTARPLADALLVALEESIPPGAIQRSAIAGSIRRWRDTIGDMDLLVVTTDVPTVMVAFRSLPHVAEVLMSGSTKTSVRLHAGLQVDLRVVPAQSWGTALQYFTGSQAHNVALRQRALRLGFSLNEYSLTRLADGMELFFRDEPELYEALDMAYVPPELREDRGEITAAVERRLPMLLEQHHIQGELHGHTTWSDGKASIAEMAEAARSAGYRYFAITDHSGSLGVTGVLDVARLRAQREEIDAYNAQAPAGFRLLHGAEVEVLADGSLDYPDEVLAWLDVVVASWHSGLRQDRETITARALRAVRNPHVDIVGHPTGRLLPRREPADLDMEALIQAAAETGTILEINAHPSRLDLNDIYARRALDLGVTLAINCDAHRPEELALLCYGVATARRAWATPDQVINAWSLDRVLARLGHVG